MNEGNEKGIEGGKKERKEGSNEWMKE